MSEQEKKDFKKFVRQVWLVMLPTLVLTLGSFVWNGAIDHFKIKHMEEEVDSLQTSTGQAYAEMIRLIQNYNDALERKLMALENQNLQQVREIEQALEKCNDRILELVAANSLKIRGGKQ